MNMPHRANAPVALSAVEAKKRIAAAQSLVVDVPPVFRLSVLQAHRWVCVALEDELDSEAARKLAEACAAAGFVRGWSVEVPWTTEQHVIASHRLPLTADAIQSVTRDAYLGSCYVLGEEADGFAVASDGDLYWMLAGPRNFVEASIGHSVAAQLSAFDKLVASYNPHESLAGKRLAAAQKLCQSSLEHAGARSV